MRTGRPRIWGTKLEVEQVIDYLCTDHESRELNWLALRNQLKLPCAPRTLKRRLNESGYYSCVECQKPYLSRKQADARWIWGLTYLFWTITQWCLILWSDEVTFQLGAKQIKKRCIRKAGERTYPDYIQFQIHRGGTTPVHFWGAIGYGYKGTLVHINGTGKHGAFKQVDYLSITIYTEASISL